MPSFAITIGSAVLAIIVGILVLIFPGFLRLAVGLYLVLFGILQIVGDLLP